MAILNFPIDLLFVNGSYYKGSGSPAQGSSTDQAGATLANLKSGDRVFFQGQDGSSGTTPTNIKNVYTPGSGTFPYAAGVGVFACYPVIRGQAFQPGTSTTLDMGGISALAKYFVPTLSTNGALAGWDYLWTVYEGDRDTQYEPIFNYPPMWERGNSKGYSLDGIPRSWNWQDGTGPQAIVNFNPAGDVSAGNLIDGNWYRIVWPLPSSTVVPTAWNSGTNYSTGNQVSYDDGYGVQWYQAIAGGSNHAPSTANLVNSSFWARIPSMYNWSSTYKVGDIVIFDNLTGNNPNIPPNTSNTIVSGMKKLYLCTYNPGTGSTGVTGAPTWNSGTAYAIGQNVSYQEAGTFAGLGSRVYTAVASTTGNAPSVNNVVDSAHWAGPIGMINVKTYLPIPTAIYPTWAGGTTYAIGNVVSYNGDGNASFVGTGLYRSIVNGNIGNTPSTANLTDSAHWVRVTAAAPFYPTWYPSGSSPNTINYPQYMIVSYDPQVGGSTPGAQLYQVNNPAGTLQAPATLSGTNTDWTLIATNPSFIHWQLLQIMPVMNGVQQGQAMAKWDMIKQVYLPQYNNITNGGTVCKLLSLLSFPEISNVSDNSLTIPPGLPNTWDFGVARSKIDDLFIEMQYEQADNSPFTPASVIAATTVDASIASYNAAHNTALTWVPHLSIDNSNSHTAGGVEGWLTAARPLSPNMSRVCVFVNANANLTDINKLMTDWRT